jgi:hypothetical protein
LLLLLVVVVAVVFIVFVGPWTMHPLRKWLRASQALDEVLRLGKLRFEQPSKWRKGDQTYPTLSLK